MMDPLMWGPTDTPSGLSERLALKEGLLQALWGPQNLSFDGINSFFDHYFKERIRIEVHGLGLNTHKALVELIQFIRDNTSISREELIDKLKQDHETWLSPADDSPDRALETALRIWLMVRTEDWSSTDSLMDYIHKSFPDEGNEGNIVEVLPFPLDFNAYELKRIGGFNIVWTDCLQDHLSLTVSHTQRELRIFYLASFIQNYQHTPESSIFPSGFLLETAQTISFLFPSSHLDCREWIDKVQRDENFDLEASIFPPVSRDIRKFRYWGQKLRAVRAEYDSTEPTTIKQWFLDRRRPNQRYTFWIAIAALILALLFGLIQSVTGIIQAIVTVRNS